MNDNKNPLSLAKLKEMQENGTVFYTADGRDRTKEYSRFNLKAMYE